MIDVSFITTRMYKKYIIIYLHELIDLVYCWLYYLELIDTADPGRWSIHITTFDAITAKILVVGGGHQTIMTVDAIMQRSYEGHLYDPKNQKWNNNDFLVKENPINISELHSCPCRWLFSYFWLLLCWADWYGKSCEMIHTYHDFWCDCSKDPSSGRWSSNMVEQHQKLEAGPSSTGDFV